MEAAEMGKSFGVGTETKEIQIGTGNQTREPLCGRVRGSM